jgi:hypothetical protein
VVVRVVERRRDSRSRDKAIDPSLRARGIVLRPGPLALLAVAGEQDDDRVEVGAGEPSEPVRVVDAGVSSTSARAAMPCRNSSGNVESEASLRPSARKPFQVKATVTHRLSFSTEDRTCAPDCTFSRTAPTQARPAAALRKVRNS